MSKHSNADSSSGKGRPKKPRKDFPLYPHRAGYWAKKVRGRTVYFGRVSDDPKGKAALELWLEQKDDLLAGREPRPKSSDELTVADLCNEFITHKETLRDNRELSPRTYRGYFDTCARVVKVFKRGRIVADLSPADFGQLRKVLARTRGPVALRNEMQRVRSIFKFAFDHGLILAPIRYGQSFAKPKLDIVRKAREAHRERFGDRMFEAKEIRAILADCKQPLRAMILLAANTGLGQTDIARLPLKTVNLDTGWVDYARPKTGVPRHIPLWPETVKALRQWIQRRPKARQRTDARLMFLTVRGAPWVKVNDKGAPKDAILQEFNKVVRRLGLKRPRRGFYSLRHGFETVGCETGDQIAVNAIMGHVDTSMAGTYRERIGEDRLRRVTNHIRAWLFPTDTPDDTPEKLKSVFCAPCAPESESTEQETPIDNGGFKYRIVG
ncbi:MAG: tyrosine-type recombinase/integrase [Pirellulales bacterium]|nr:tyrosine-type recombinase/integrase [Pirellulales bacterium]